MGSNEDPVDGGAVAGAVFGAVAIYGVCQFKRDVVKIIWLTYLPGFPRLLRWSSMVAPKGQVKRRHRPVLIYPPYPIVRQLYQTRY